MARTRIGRARVSDAKLRAGPSAPLAACYPAVRMHREGKDIGGFHVTQSVEFGGRINEYHGQPRRCMTRWSIIRAGRAFSSNR